MQVKPFRERNNPKKKYKSGKECEKESRKSRLIESSAERHGKKKFNKKFKNCQQIAKASRYIVARFSILESGQQGEHKSF